MSMRFVLSNDAKVRIRFYACDLSENRDFISALVIVDNLLFVISIDESDNLAWPDQQSRVP